MMETMKKEHPLTDPWRSLADAIVIQAAKDYRKALGRLRRNPDNASAKTELAKIERFFRSDWYDSLTSVPGELIIRKLKEENEQ